MYKYFIELRNRLGLVLLAFISTILVSWVYREILIYLLMTLDVNLNIFIFTNIYEIIHVYLKLTFCFGIDVSLVYVFYHLINFMNPLFFKNEYYFIKYVFQKVLVCVFPLLLITNNIILPSIFKVLRYSNSSDFVNFHFEQKLYEFTIFFINLFHVIFITLQFFYFVLIVIFMKPRTSFFFKKVRKFFYLLLLLSSVLLLPDDLCSQVFIFFSLVFFFELFCISNFFFKPEFKKINKVMHLSLKGSWKYK